MRTDRVQVALRSREGLEAVDLGFRMVREWWRPLAATWLLFVLPFGAALVVEGVVREVRRYLQRARNGEGRERGKRAGAPVEHRECGADQHGRHPDGERPGTRRQPPGAEPPRPLSGCVYGRHG